MSDLPDGLRAVDGQPLEVPGGPVIVMAVTASIQPYDVHSGPLDQPWRDGLAPFFPRWWGTDEHAHLLELLHGLVEDDLAARGVSVAPAPNPGTRRYAPLGAAEERAFPYPTDRCVADWGAPCGRTVRRVLRAAKADVAVAVHFNLAIDVIDGRLWLVSLDVHRTDRKATAVAGVARTPDDTTTSVAPLSPDWIAVWNDGGSLAHTFADAVKPLLTPFADAAWAP